MTRQLETQRVAFVEDELPGQKLAGDPLTGDLPPHDPLRQEWYIQSTMLLDVLTSLSDSQMLLDGDSFNSDLHEEVDSNLTQLRNRSVVLT